MSDRKTDSKNNQRTIQLLIGFLAVILTLSQLFFTFRGLDQPAAMDQAQIAREVARGNGLTTKFLRPVDVVSCAQQQQTAYNPLETRDTTYAPLPILVESVALKITGADDAEAIKMTEESSNIYAPDRVIAAVSSFFFLVALGLGYFFLKDLFDELIASVCVLLMTLSNLFLQFAASGLPQMMMLCLFIGASHTLLLAVRATVDGNTHARQRWLIISSLLMALVCMTGWIGIWPLIGYSLFVAFYFRPFGLYSLLPIGMVLVFSAYFLIQNYATTGSLFGNAAFGIYNSFGSGEEAVMRVANQSSAPLEASDFLLRLFGISVSQMDQLYVSLGSIAVAPFFFPALLHAFKKPETQAIKWATFSMWFFAMIGMALYGTKGALSAGQLNILFTPVMCAFGLSLVLLMLARLKLNESATFVRNFILVCIVLVSAGTFLTQVPENLRIGLRTSGKGIPHWPPYYPPALAGTLNGMTNDKQIVMTDMPWAVAWYADRPALWLPKRIEDLETKIMPVLNAAETDIQGIVISPVSHSRSGGMNAIVSEYGDFAPLAMEGMLLALSPKHNFRYVELFHEKEGTAAPLGEWVSNTGKYDNITSLLGAQLLYYNKKSDTAN